ncbi:hypothetical protein [Cohnella herbarum]|uniref:Aldouronate transport system substrate-binding protein n=1 Tax=Cohnella herbarum TaxID=2728023 RepID=A0A7Z2VNM7_9BACL|nr:hypothetical protein [Cohnella herbarum]QJD86311.1 hypothetical protein HH215_26190 [Cohnella herbarum]
MKPTLKAGLSITLVSALMFTAVACSGGNKNGGNNAAPSASSVATESGSSASASAPAAEKPDPFGKEPELVEFTTGIAVSAEANMPAGESFENNDVQKWFLDNLNVKPKVEWTTSDQNFAFDQKVNLLIAANNIPDVIGLSVEPNGLNILSKLVKAGMIEDLTQVFEDYASPSLKSAYALGGPDIMKSVTFDGKLYAIPSISDVETAIPVVWTRKDWLDKVGLQEPQTLEDVENVLKTFKAEFNAGALPSQQNIYNTDTASFDFVFGAYNSYPAQWITGADGSIVYGSVQPEAKAALQRLANWYKDGLIPKDFMMNDGTKAVEAIAKGSAGIFQGAWWATWFPLPDSVKNDPKAEWTATVLKGVDGIAHARGYGNVRSFVVVKKGFKNPGAIMKAINVSQEANTKKLDWYNKLTFDEGSKYINAKMGLLPVGVSAKDPFEISKRYKDIMEVVDGKKDLATADPETQVQVKSIQSYEKATDKLADMGLWSLANQFAVGAAAFTKNPVQMTLPAFIGTTDLMQKKKASLDDLEKRTYLEIITGKKPIDEFDKFVAQWKSMGGDDITAEVNDIAGK